MNRRRYVLATAWVLFSAVVGSLYLSPPQYIDHRWFDYLGGAMLEGELPYRDLGDQNFPGIILLHALALWLFGSHTWSFPLLDYLLLNGFLLVMARTLQRRVGVREALFFPPIYLLMYVSTGTGISGQRDLLATHCTLLAGVFLLRRIEGGHWIWLILDSLAIFMAAMLKPTFALAAVALPLIDLVTRHQSGRSWARMAADHAIEAFTMIAAVGIIALVGWRVGILGAWYEWFQFNSQIYRSLKASNEYILGRARLIAMTYWPMYIVIAFIGGLLWLRRGDRPLLVVLIASFTTAAVSLIVQAKGWDYHFAAFLPIMGILMSYALAWASRVLTAGPLIPRIRQARTTAFPVALATLMLVLTPLTIAKKVYRCYRVPVGWQLGLIGEAEYLNDYNLVGVEEVVTYVEEHTTPRETVWSFADLILDLNYLAHRRSPSRFWNPYHIFHAVAPFSLAPQWQAEVADVIRNHPPKIVVMHSQEPPKSGYDYPPEWSNSPIGAIFDETLAKRYRLVKTIERFEIYELVN